MILHSVDENFVKTRLVLYLGKIAAKTAAVQAQRVIATCRGFHIDPEHLVWVVATDNTPSAYNVARELSAEILRCGAHIIALGPKHLFYPVKRIREDGEGVKTEVLAIHEDADTEAFRLLEKVRREHKRVRENEKNRLKFEAGQAATRKVPLVALGDSSAKWVGASPMCERRWVIRDHLGSLATRRSSMTLAASCLAIK